MRYRLCTPLLRDYAPIDVTSMGDVRPGAGIFVAQVTGGRAP
jgi:hypothetical protein